MQRLVEDLFATFYFQMIEKCYVFKESIGVLLAVLTLRFYYLY